MNIDVHITSYVKDRNDLSRRRNAIPYHRVWQWNENIKDWNLIWLSLFERAIEGNVGYINWDKHTPFFFSKVLYCIVCFVCRSNLFHPC